MPTDVLELGAVGRAESDTDIAGPPSRTMSAVVGAPRPGQQPVSDPAIAKAASPSPKPYSPDRTPGSNISCRNKIPAAADHRNTPTDAGTAKRHIDWRLTTSATSTATEAAPITASHAIENALPGSTDPTKARTTTVTRTTVTRPEVHNNTATTNARCTYVKRSVSPPATSAVTTNQDAAAASNSAPAGRPPHTVNTPATSSEHPAARSTSANGTFPRRSASTAKATSAPSTKPTAIDDDLEARLTTQSLRRHHGCRKHPARPPTRANGRRLAARVDLERSTERRPNAGIRSRRATGERHRCVSIIERFGAGSAGCRERYWHTWATAAFGISGRLADDAGDDVDHGGDDDDAKDVGRRGMGREAIESSVPVAQCRRLDRSSRS